MDHLYISQISQIDQNGGIAFRDKTLYEYIPGKVAQNMAFYPLTLSLREPDGPCTKPMAVLESRMERVNSPKT